MIIINEVLRSKRQWKKEYERMNNYFKNNIGKNGTFEKFVSLKFYKNDIDSFKMRVNDYFINLIMWQPFIKFKIKLNKENIIFNTDNITQRSIKDYMDTKIICKFRGEYENKSLNKECAKVLEILSKICSDYSIIMAQGINVYNFIQLSKRNEKFVDLINTDIPETLQPSEIENYLDELNNDLVDLLSKEDNCFKHCLNAGQGVVKGQLNEFLVSVGMKPDLEGNTCPIPINTNLFVKGLDTPSHYLLDACGGRKALIMKLEYTGLSGYFARKLDLLCLNILLHEDSDYDCKTKRLVKFTINNYDELVNLNGMYYKRNPDDMLLRIVDYRKDLKLIGKTIYLRNAATCNSKHGICHVCYGELSKINYDIAIGLFAVKELTSKFTQNILSSKHLMKTESMEMKMPPLFTKLFTIDGSNIILDPTIENESNYTLIIDADEIVSDNDDNGDFSDNLKSIERFKIKKKNGETTIIKDENENIFYLTDYLLDNLYYDEEDKYYFINLKKIIDSDEALFWFKVSNNELTKPLNDVKSLIDSKNHCGCETIDEMAQMFSEYLLESKITINMAHVFVIMRNVIRRNDNILELPDFSNLDECENYTLLSVSKALKFHPSPVVSLGFERIKEQLKNPITFKKSGSSMLDPLFRIKGGCK